jgi:hypothetical protein
MMAGIVFDAGRNAEKSDMTGVLIPAGSQRIWPLPQRAVPPDSTSVK